MTQRTGRMKTMMELIEMPVIYPLLNDDDSTALGVGMKVEAAVEYKHSTTSAIYNNIQVGMAWAV